MTKGTYNLHEFLRKCIMRLTQVWLLPINDLATSCKCAVYQQVRRLLNGQYPPNGFRGAIFLYEFPLKPL